MSSCDVGDDGRDCSDEETASDTGDEAGVPALDRVAMIRCLWLSLCASG